MRDIASIDGIRWIRLLYVHPASLTAGILETIAAEKKICPYIDIPIQHIDDGLLKAMNRKGGSDLIREKIGLARSIVPGVVLRTSLITGFPGEKAAEFKKLLDFIRQTRFDHLGVFTYSREEGTRAASLHRAVAESVKEHRRGILMKEQALVSHAINRSLIGSLQEALVEGASDMPGYLLARCRRQAPEIDGVTYLKPRKGLRPGDYIRCRITGADEYDLFAETESVEPRR